MNKQIKNRVFSQYVRTEVLRAASLIRGVAHGNYSSCIGHNGGPCSVMRQMAVGVVYAYGMKSATAHTVDLALWDVLFCAQP